jgi:hypothetical protein
MRTKKRSAKMGMWVMVVGMSFTFNSLITADERVLINGVVSTIKDSSGAITAGTLNLKVEGEGIFNIVLDEQGKKLGAEMEGKWVEVIGEISMRGAEKWLEVKSYSKVEEGVLP